MSQWLTAIRRPAWFTLAGALTLASCGRTGLDPMLVAERDFVRFSARVGDTVTAVPLGIQTPGGAALGWHLAHGAPWLLAAPATGVGPATVWLSVRTTELAPGTHRATISITAEGEDLPVTVGVELVLDAPGWASLEGPAGGYMYSVARHPLEPDYVLAGTSSGSLYVSHDGGLHFVRAGQVSGAVVDLALCDGDVAYLASSSGGLYRSDDRGITWLPTALQPVSLSGLALDPAQPDLVLAQGLDLWRTSDGGASWTTVGLATPTRFVGTDPHAPGVFVAGGESGTLYRGNGTTFTAIDTGAALPLSSYTSLPSGRWLVAHAPGAGSDYPDVSYSDDVGASWTTVPGTLAWPSVHMDTYLLGVFGGTLWLNNLSEGVAYSTDQGETYTRVPLGFSRSVDSGSQLRRVSPGADRILAPSYGEGVLSYTADGSTLGFTRSRIYGHSVAKMDLSPAAGLLVLLTSSQQLLAYDAAGGFRGLYGTGSEGSYNGILVDPRNPFVLHASFHRHNHGVLRSADGGLSWEHTSGVQANDISRAPDDPDVLWVASTDPLGVFRSTDNGITWTQVAAAGSGYRVLAISAQYALVMSGSSLVRVDATGATTTVVSGGVTSLIGRSLDGSVWLHAGSLQRSTDDGQSFSGLELMLDSYGAVAAHPDHPDRIFVGSTSGLLRSDDGGATWVDLAAPFGVSSMVMVPDSGALYVGTNGGGLYLYAP